MITCFYNLSKGLLNDSICLPLDCSGTRGWSGPARRFRPELNKVKEALDNIICDATTDNTIRILLLLLLLLFGRQNNRNE